MLSPKDKTPFPQIPDPSHSSDHVIQMLAFMMTREK
jgi:hypothetical protein